MANEKKPEKKQETAAAPTVAAGPAPIGGVSEPLSPSPVPLQGDIVAAPPSKSASLAVRGANLPAVPTLEQLDVLEQNAILKFNALSVFLTDDTLSAESKLGVREIIDLANPVKQGMEEMNAGWSIAQIRLCQPTTNDPKKPEAARPGDLFTTAGDLLDKPFGFIPIYFNQENIMFKLGEKAPICAAPDAKLGSAFGPCITCPHLPFGLQNGGRGDQNITDCQNQIVVGMLSLDLKRLFLFQFGKTSRAAGNALMSLARAQKTPWQQSYNLLTEKKVTAQGTYWIAKVEPTGKNNSPEVLRIAAAVNELYTAQRKKALGNYYFKALNSGAAAVAAEGNFNDDALAAGLGINTGTEPDLSGAAAPTAAGPSVRSSSKPM